MPRLILLVDSDAWVAPLVDALAARATSAEVVNVRDFQWTAHDELSDWGLVVNRVAARPEAIDGHPAAMLRKTQDLLVALELAGVACIHGSRTYAIGSSKMLQAQCFHAAGLRTPATRLVTQPEFPEEISGCDPAAWLIKPNQGAFGTAIRPVGSPETDAAFTMDGLAVIQERVSPGEPFVYRAEYVDTSLAYLAASPLQPEDTSYCLAQAGAEVLLSRELPAGLAEKCDRLLRLTEMQMGSVEYLIDDEGVPTFIDINPVSSPLPDAARRIGVDVWDLQADLICDALRRCGG